MTTRISVHRRMEMHQSGFGSANTIEEDENEGVVEYQTFQIRINFDGIENRIMMN